MKGGGFLKKSVLRKNALIEITKTKNRFLSIFGIVAIGVAFFAGVKNAAPDMRLSADSYYNDCNLSDFRLVSTLGYSESDIDALEALEGINVYPSYFTDAVIKADTGESTVRVLSLDNYGENNEVNSLVLKEGRFPTSPGECLADGGSLLTTMQLGEKVVFSSGDDSDISDTLERTEYTIVGTFDSPMYIDKSSRGNTTVGNGSIKSVFYIPQDNFKTEVYTQVYITADELRGLNSYSDEYKNLSEEIMSRLEATGEIRETERYDEIISEATAEINDAKAELEEKRAEAYAEFEKAENELSDALDEITSGEQELIDARKELDDAKAEIESNRIKLDDAWVQLENAKREFYDSVSRAEVELNKNAQLLDEKMAEFEKGYAEFLTGKAEYEAALSEFEKGLAEYQAGVAVYTLYSDFYSGAITLEELMAGLLALSTQNAPETTEGEAPAEQETQAPEPGFMLLTQDEVAAMGEQLAQTKPVLDGTALVLSQSGEEIAAAEQQLNAGKKELDDAYAKLEAGRAELRNTKEETEQTLKNEEKKLEEAEIAYENGVSEYKQGEQDYAKGVSDLEKGKDDYNDGLAEYEKEKADALLKISDAEKEIKKAENELSDLENPTWYVFDRNANPGFSEYGSNADRINNIASIFPVFFVLVAALVCLTTMTRMVDEQRVQIGTLKALGYGNASIIFKYMLYALVATTLGALVGGVFGQKLFPAAIIFAYGMLYSIPTMLIPVDWVLIGLTALVSAGAVSLTVYASCRSALRERPAQLMRPKAPKLGRKIFLEYLPFWKKSSFNTKVTARNIFRYKRRMFMTIVGIAGCTALTLTGFALRDSINGIVSKQFGELDLYDGIMQFEPETADVDEIEAILSENGGSALKYSQKNFSISSGSSSSEAYVYVAEKPEEINNFFTHRDRITHEKYYLDDSGVFIDEKLSLLLGVKVGDEITVSVSDTEKFNVKISAVIENYPNHYVYMTPKLYSEKFGEEPQYNTFAFIRDGLETREAEEEFTARLLRVNGVLGASYNDAISNTFSTMLKALDMVIVIIIISAGALAFVVLYNLTNININERIREIATLKVLGFYDGEVDGYVFRENVILTLMGTAVGLFGGYYLANFIIQTAEIDMVMFGRDVSVLSYVLAAVVTVLFAVLVTLYMHRHLKRIDMIEALKSVE